jgi:TetR/AcrR family transcriptional repressor of bet genes
LKQQRNSKEFGLMAEALRAVRTMPQGGAATRASILEATIGVIARQSLSGTTVERVALAAKVAPGTVILHFKRKEALLVEVLDHLTSEFERARANALRESATDPVEALKRLIATMFDPAVSAPDKVAVWYAFWGEAGSRRTYLERVGAIDDRYHEDILRIIGDLIRRGGHSHLDAEAVATGFIGVLEYLWQEIMVEGAAFDRSKARRTALNYLAGLFPEAFALET